MFGAFQGVLLNAATYSSQCGCGVLPTHSGEARRRHPHPPLLLVRTSRDSKALTTLPMSDGDKERHAFKTCAASTTRESSGHLPVTHQLTLMVSATRLRLDRLVSKSSIVLRRADASHALRTPGAVSSPAVTWYGATASRAEASVRGCVSTNGCSMRCELILVSRTRLSASSFP